LPVKKCVKIEENMNVQKPSAQKVIEHSGDCTDGNPEDHILTLNPKSARKEITSHPKRKPIGITEARKQNRFAEVDGEV
jgi:hypothetical protein